MDYTYELLARLITGFAEWPQWLRIATVALVTAFMCFNFMAVGPILYVYAERKIAGFMQDRLGPMRVGPYGVLQTIADTIKLLFKEAIYPRGVDRFLFKLGPGLVVMGSFMGFVVVPWGSSLIPADLNIGVFYVAAISSLLVVGGLVLWPVTAQGFAWDGYVGWPITLVVFGYLVVKWLQARCWQALVL